MKQYVVLTIGKGNHIIGHRFDDFESAYEKYKAIIDASIDSDWLESVYKNTKIGKWNPALERYETI